jgi:aspartate carbamoyltransferase catalytic subunit
LFFEPSTRTRNTFELAARRCGATVINIDIKNSATKKNESLIDTIKTLEAMQIDIFIVRHKLKGLPHRVAKNTKGSIINAGDGTNEHPTQALLDILTISKYKKNFEVLSIAIIGDIKHSRVAHSDINALLTLGVKDIRLISPYDLDYHNCQSSYITHTNDIDKGVQGVDVIIVLRLQKERMLASDIPNETQYFSHFGLTQQRLSLARPDAIVMHPGPINREVEIASNVADSKQSLILEQVTNGIAIRMAVMSLLMQNKYQ